MRSLLLFLQRLCTHRGIIWSMARREIQLRYAGTIAGLIWSVIHPLMLILTYWLVFSKGLKIRPAADVPFIAFFLSGLIPWTAFAETTSASTNAITSSPHLVKRILFPTEILPVVHFTASLVNHAVMLVVLVVVLIFYGMWPSLYALQFLYFAAGLSVFCVGLGWIVSALNVFYRDVGQIILVVLNMWFWLTPIVWPPENMQSFNPTVAFCLKLNPMYYVVQGYRASFIYRTGLWEHWRLGAYFWAVSLAVFALGGVLFRKLKPDFPDVL